MIRCLLTLTTVALLIPSLTLAQSPAATYSGRLTDGTGWGQSAQVQLVVRVYDGSGQTELWRSPTMPVDVVDGYFSVVLSGGTDPGGSPKDIADVFAANPETCLTVEVGGNEVLPCQAIGSVPYAIEARYLGGRETGGYVWNQTGIPQPGGFNVSGDGFLGGRLGLGTTSPLTTVDVKTQTGRKTTGLSLRSPVAALNVWPGAGSGVVVDVTDGTVNGTTGSDLYVRTGGVDRVYVSRDGKVGIGTVNPKTSLHVSNGSLFLDGEFAGTPQVIFSPIPGSTGHQWELYPIPSGFDTYDRTAKKAWLSISNEGLVGIRTSNPQAVLHVKGNVQIDDKCTATAQGTCDLAETFLSLDNATPGDVVVLDPSRFKAMRLADRPYDPAIAGVVSTDPTLVMGQSDVPEGIPVAIAGVVPVKITLEGGPIEVGDPLTSSSTPGHAMRAGRPGPVIGKAMEPFDGTEGWAGTVRVLVAPGACSDTADLEARVRALEATVTALTQRLDQVTRHCGPASRKDR